MNNIENKIKTEFKNREITPSNDAWNKLNSKLNAVEVIKENKNIIYYRVVAVVIGLLIAFSFLITSNESKINTDVEILVNHKIKKDSKSTIEVVNTNVIEKVSIDIKNDSNTVITKSNNKINKQKISVKKRHTQLLASNYKQKQVSENVTQKEVAIIENNLAIADKIIMIKNNTINPEKIKPKKVLMNSSDKDIDAMLAIAMSNSKINQKKIVVNSNELAVTVKNELDINSKSKILKVIERGVDTVESLLVSNK